MAVQGLPGTGQGGPGPPDVLQGLQRPVAGQEFVGGLGLSQGERRKVSRTEKQGLLFWWLVMWSFMGKDSQVV